jgi:hypothetical protein
VTYATSFATLALQRRAAPLPEHPVPGVLAAPVIPDAIRAQLLLTRPDWKPQDAEAAVAAGQAVAAAYGEAIVIRSAADASETAARTLLGASDVLHVQAPLQVSGGAPLLSSVILAATGDAPAENGRLDVRDWFTLEGRARVLVLPDGSAFGAAGVGSAMDALAWAAASAGISTVIVGRWPLEGFTADALAAAWHAKSPTRRAARARRRPRGPAFASSAGSNDPARAIGDEVAPTHRFRDVLHRADEGDGVQRRVDAAADDPLALHRFDDRQHGDGGSDPRQRLAEPSGHALRQMHAAPADEVFPHAFRCCKTASSYP